MLYSSTRGEDKNKSFTEVLLNGLAGDGGLYVPNKIPYFSKKKLKSLSNLNYSDLAFELTKQFLSSDIPENEYKRICSKTYKNAFGKEIISITKLSDNEFISNLYHGPTFAFKDFALQLLGNIYEFILKKKNLKLTIIGATSGDTGSAAINGCSKSDNINMFILFPKGKVSEVQRKQMTTFNKANVSNIAVKGNFDDCQKLVKDFFKMNHQNKKINLAAVNSINWVRIMGQIVYYFWSFFRVSKNFDPISFVVPTGNFGNAYAGYISKVMGLPIDKIVISSNKNDILTRFFRSGVMSIRKAHKSLSPSMDIQVSSNFERLLYHFYRDGNKIKNIFLELETKGKFKIQKTKLNEMKLFFESGKLDDKETIKTIKFFKNKYDIIIDPHTAVGCSVGNKKLSKSKKRVYLATAHYAKFLNTVKKSINIKIDYPPELKDLMKKEEKFYLIGNSIRQLKELIIKNN